MEKSHQRVLVVLPNWVGDVVLATPVLAALRAHFGPHYVSAAALRGGGG
jgi:ADP-heptose:LPS heptosyltransferase